MPRQPFVGLAIAAMLGILAGDFFSIPQNVIFPVAGVLAAVALLVLIWPRPLVVYLLVVVGFFLLHNIRTIGTPGLRLASWIGEGSRVATVTGVITSEPKTAANGFATFVMKMTQIEAAQEVYQTNASIFVRWRGHPQFGDELKLFGVIEPIEPPRNPGQFDMRSYLARQDVLRQIFVRYAENSVLLAHGGGNPVLRAAQAARGWLQTTICRGLEDSPDVQSFLSGITLGLRHQTPEDIEDPFQQTGTLHLFAVAGLHVGIIARLLWMLATVGQLSRKWAAALIIPCLLFYAAVTGLHVSSIRAAIMGSVLLGGLFFERKVFNLNSLAAAAFLLLSWNTNELFATGFQLSFAVVGAIILLADPLSVAAEKRVAPDPFLPASLVSIPRRMIYSGMSAVARGSAVSAAAWIGSLLLILWYFHLVAPVSLVANLVVVPIAFFVLAIALISVVSAPVTPWLSLIVNNANWSLARFVIAAVHMFAQFPGGHFYIGVPRWPDGSHLVVNVLDLGSGAAVHVRTSRRDWLFDCGSERDYERVVREYLRTSGINRLSGLTLSHGDAQHIGAAERVISDFGLGVVFDNPAPDRSSVHRRLRSAWRISELRTGELAAGNELTLSDTVALRVFYPEKGFSSKNADDQAAVVQLVTPSARLLLVSDSGERTEQALLAQHVDLRSDILIKGKHHSAWPGSEQFLAAVAPRVIIATSRDFPYFEKIDENWAERVRTSGITLLRQDKTGAVELRFRPNDWDARCYLTGQTVHHTTLKYP